MTDKRRLNVETGKQGFQKTEKQTASETDLSAVAAHVYNFPTEYTDAYGNEWEYFEGDSMLGENRKGWLSTSANGAQMEVSNDGTSTFGHEWNTYNTDALSTGGATDCEDEAFTLSAEQAAWGVCGIKYDQKSPWGKVEDIKRVAPGITFVGTSSQGGVKLSPERNKAIPKAFRNRSGWYEEYAEMEKVRLQFPEAFVAKRDHFRGVPRAETVAEIRKDAAKHVRSHFPDEFSAAGFGPVEVSQSKVLRQRAFEERSKESLAVRSAKPAYGKRIGMVEVTTKNETTGEEARFLVPGDEYRKVSATNGGFIVDEKRHTRI